MLTTPRLLSLRDAPAPVDNPLKGLVPYSGLHTDRFPHSLEFNYLPLSALVTGEERYDWTPLEGLLQDIAGRGHQSVFRLFLEYPGKSEGIPRYLVDGGLKVHRYLNTNTQPFPPTPVTTPDYADPNLRRCLTRFIAALGARYDGDARIGFITAGLLGTWGEWHTYPRNDLWASKAVQTEVLDAYEMAFRTTPVLLRYPAGPRHAAQAPNAQRPFGYHDDSFAWATLDTGKPQDDWFFIPALKAAGPQALAKWKTHPIGGEIRPEAWGKVFDPAPDDPHIQDFARCVAQTHATWLMDTGLFQEKPTARRQERAEKLVRRMGYAFHIPSVALWPQKQALRLAVTIENRGVAPFYAPWPIEFALLTPGGAAIRTWRGHGSLQGLLPSRHPACWQECLELSGVAPGRHWLALRVPNPMPGGKPVRFANETQDRHAPGWLTLGTVLVER